jgi:hypothetical protein
MMTLKMRVGLATPVMRATMNKEYLQAKADLCLDQAKIDLEQEEIARAIANLKRANSALAQLFGFQEGESE